jgi:hypothetical protein
VKLARSLRDERIPPGGDSASFLGMVLSRQGMLPQDFLQKYPLGGPLAFPKTLAWKQVDLATLGVGDITIVDKNAYIYEGSDRAIGMTENGIQEIQVKRLVNSSDPCSGQKAQVGAPTRETRIPMFSGCVVSYYRP